MNLAERVRALPGMSELLPALEGLAPAHLVGGAVRDLLRGADSVDIDIAVALCLALAKEDRVEQALARLQALHEVKGYPDYLRNLEAELWERKAEWGKAWNALKPFVSR